MRPDLFLATIGRGSNGSNALEVTEDRAAVTAESQDNIINRVNNISQYGPSWHYVPGIGVAGTAYAEVPGSALGDLAFSRASSKTRTNAAGVVETIGNNVPPHDYRNADGTLSTFPRLNLEPQRTNSIRNSSMVGAVAGSPGTLPTNWENTSTSGLNRTVVGIGIESGLPYIDFRFYGTSTGTAFDIRAELPNIISALTGQIWSESFYLKLISASAAPNSYQIGIYERASAGTIVSFGSQSVTVTNSLQRFTYTRTLNGGATVAFVQPYVFFTLTNGATYDFTIRIAAPQMELGAYATTWVPTTTAAVTRLIDVTNKTGISSLIGQTEGVLFIDFVWNGLTGNGSFPRIIEVATDSNNIIQIYTLSGTTTYKWEVINGGVVQFTGTSTMALGQNKIAIAYKLNDMVVYRNGALVASDTSCTIPATSALGLTGTFNGTGGAQLAASVNQAALFQTRLTNAQLVQLTTL